MRTYVQPPEGYEPPTNCAECGGRIMYANRNGLEKWVHLAGQPPTHEVVLVGMWWDPYSGWRKPDEIWAKPPEDDGMLHGGPDK